MKEVINRSIDFIMQHLNENITVKDVADHFHFSEYHFSRMFRAETGYSLYGFIQRLKMDQSAIYTFEGRVADIFGALQGVFTVWLPQSTHVMDERYGLNIYRTVDFIHEYVIMDLCIPVK